MRVAENVAAESRRSQVNLADNFSQAQLPSLRWSGATVGPERGVHVPTCPPQWRLTSALWIAHLLGLTRVSRWILEYGNVHVNHPSPPKEVLSPGGREAIHHHMTLLLFIYVVFQFST